MRMPGFDLQRVRRVGDTAAMLIGLLLLVAVITYAVAPDGRSPSTRVVLNFFITVVMVVGLQVFTGNSGVASYCHAGFVGLGAYVTAWVAMDLSVKERILPNLPPWLLSMELGFWPTVVLSAVVGGLVALLIGAVVMRMQATALAMSTLALLVIAHGVFNNWDTATNGAQGLYGVPVRVNLWLALAFAAAAIVVGLLFKQCGVGLQLQASREDVLAASTTGVNVVAVRWMAWVLSAVMCTTAGSLWAQFNLAFGPTQFYWDRTLMLLSVMVIGGMANVSGAVVGAGVYTLVYEFLRNIEENGSLFGIRVPSITGLTQMVVAIAILVILIYRRDGLLAWWELDTWARRGWRRMRGARGVSASRSATENGEARSIDG